MADDRDKRAERDSNPENLSETTGFGLQNFKSQDWQSWLPECFDYQNQLKQTNSAPLSASDSGATALGVFWGFSNIATLYKNEISTASADSKTASNPGSSMELRKTGQDEDTGSIKVARDGKGKEAALIVSEHTIPDGKEVVKEKTILFEKIQAKIVVVKNTDNLDGLARQQLGASATSEAIAEYKAKIMQVNDLKNEKLDRVQALKLPGQTADGSLVILEPGDVTRTIHPNGVVEVSRGHNLDGSGNPTGVHLYDIKMGGKNNYTLQHYGTRDTDRYMVSYREGTIEVRDQPFNGKLLRWQPEAAAERQRLQQLVQEKIADKEQLAKFHADMARLENRVKDSQEIKKTYAEIIRLLEFKGDVPTKEKYRIPLAEQIMAQAATPSIIDQGHHNTCNVSTVENKIYTESPSKATKLVVDIATRGEYTASDGTQARLYLKHDSLRPDREARKNPPTDGERSYASQLFQVTAVNLVYRKENPNTGIRYEQRIPALKDVDKDTGEWLVDYSTHPPKKLTDDPDFAGNKTAMAYKIIAGKPDATDVVLGSDDYRKNTPDITHFKTEQEFENKLQELRKQGKLPVILIVNVNNPPFSGSLIDAPGGGHVVIIRDYKPAKGPGKPATVFIDNQWGSQEDHEIFLHQTYISTLSYKGAKEEMAKDDEKAIKELLELLKDPKALKKLKKP